MKQHYVTPVSEEVSALLAAGILDSSGDGERSGYEAGDAFDW